MREVNTTYLKGHATELSYYPALKTLIESINPNVHVISSPKQRDCGAPDFLITKAQAIPHQIGCIEAKDLGTSIRDILKTEQIRRYRSSLNNLLLTNYTTFIWFVGGEERAQFSLGEFDEDEGIIPTTALGELKEFFSAVSKGEVEPIRGAKQLAYRMGAVGRLIKDAITRTFKNSQTTDDIFYQLNAFRHQILHDLSEDAFADMYAQTICYGLLAAKYHHTNAQLFSLETAKLPRTNPFLRCLFMFSER